MTPKEVDSEKNYRSRINSSWFYIEYKKSGKLAKNNSVV